MTTKASDGGGAPPGYGTSAATPAELQKAALEFQQLSNGCNGMLETQDLQGGGQFELQAVQFSGTGGWALPGDFTSALQQVTQGFLGVLLNAREQFADAAVDLMQVAGDFKTADGSIPAGAKPEPSTPSSITLHQDGNTPYWKDKDGTVVNGVTGEAVGQTYSPPKGTGK